MKVALINPDWGEYVSTKGSRYNRCWPPLSLLNCAALLEKERIEVALMDLRADTFNELGSENQAIPHSSSINDLVHSNDGEFERLLKPFDKVFVTSSPIDRWQCPNLEFEAFLKFINRIDKEKLFIIGVHGTMLPEKILELTHAKVIIRGEPERTVLELCKGVSLNDIDGITFYENGRVVSNKERALLDLNEMPTPAFHLLNLDNYYYEILGDRFALFEGSRGCPAACIYCLQAMYGKSYRRKHSSRLIDEVEYAIRELKVKSAYFIDLEFTLNRGLVEDLCAYLIKQDYDFRWCCQTRADTVDVELLTKMKKAGCQLIHYGVETGSDRVMKLIKKRISHSQIEEGIALTKKVGIEQACFFLFGFPSETEEEMVQTIEFAKRINPTYASFHIVSPYPGTPLFNASYGIDTFSKEGESLSEPVLKGAELERSSCCAESNDDHCGNKCQNLANDRAVKVDSSYDNNSSEMAMNYSGIGLFPEYYAEGHSMSELQRMVKRAYKAFYLRPGYLLSRVFKGNPQSWLRQYRLFKNMS